MPHHSRHESFLEGIWHDFHERFLPRGRPRLPRSPDPPKYFVSIDENVYLHDRSHNERKPIDAPTLR